MYDKAMTMLYQAAPGYFLYDSGAAFVTSKDVDAKTALNINYPFVLFFSTMTKA